MIIMCTWFEIVCNICMALGGIGTLCTFVYMISDSKKKSKQIAVVQKIQSQQLEALYEPDIRLVSWTQATVRGAQNEIVVNNSGESIQIIDITDNADDRIINTDGMSGWFPLDFDKGEEIHIPLLTALQSVNSDLIISIICLNKLKLRYSVNVRFVGGKLVVLRPVKQ